MHSSRLQQIRHKAPHVESLRSCPWFPILPQGFDPMYTVMLLNNYRSHPLLLHLPNQLFYGNKLISSADIIITHALQGWNGLPNRR